MFLYSLFLPCRVSVFENPVTISVGAPHEQVCRGQITAGSYLRCAFLNEAPGGSNAASGT